jgi:hypothetical protein
VLGKGGGAGRADGAGHGRVAPAVRPPELSSAPGRQPPTPGGGPSVPLVLGRRARGWWSRMGRGGGASWRGGGRGDLGVARDGEWEERPKGVGGQSLQVD